MCQEVIGIALCAPKNKETLVFACGDLHHVATQRSICEDSKGACVCFFGSCGYIQRIVGYAGFELSALPKIPCASCTTRGDGNGDIRTSLEIIETPLLTRNAVAEDDFPAFMNALRCYWHGATECPFHLPMNTRVNTLRSSEESPVVVNGEGPNKATKETSRPPASIKAENASEARNSIEDLGDAVGEHGMPSRLDVDAISTASSTDEHQLSATADEYQPVYITGNNDVPPSQGDVQHNDALQATMDGDQKMDGDQSPQRTLKGPQGIDTSCWAPRNAVATEQTPATTRRPMPPPTPNTAADVIATETPSKTANKVRSMREFLRLT